MNGNDAYGGMGPAPAAMQGLNAETRPPTALEQLDMLSQRIPRALIAQALAKDPLKRAELLAAGISARTGEVLTDQEAATINAAAAKRARRARRRA